MLAGVHLHISRLTVASVLPGVVEVNTMRPDNLRNVAVDNDRGSFIDADAQQLWIGLHERHHVVEPPPLAEVLVDGDPFEKTKPTLVAFRHDIQISQRVAAGEPILATEKVEGNLAVDRSFVPDQDVFALRVAGESMQGAGIMDGDFVLARQQETANQGDIVVAVIGEEATVKRYFLDGNQIRLMPENDAFDPILVDPTQEDFRIAGKIVALMRRF